MLNKTIKLGETKIINLWLNVDDPLVKNFVTSHKKKHHMYLYILNSRLLFNNIEYIYTDKFYNLLLLNFNSTYAYHFCRK